MKNSIYLLSALIIFLSSCDCYVQQKGRVLSSVDGKPIASARINLKNTNVSVVTDSLGYFNLDYVGGGNCPKPVYLVSKKGYKDFVITIDHSKSENIIKVKEGDKNYNLNGKFFYPDSTNSSTYLVSIQFDKYSKDFTIKNDSLIIYLDLDNMDVDFANYLKRLKTSGWNIDRYKIK